MQKNVSVKAIMDAIVPITRFNRGEASKIFEEVSVWGVKVVLKNNTPACVLVEPGRYERMVEMLEDYALYFEAEKRIKNPEAEDLVSHEQILNELGIGEADLDNVDVDIE